MNPSIDIDPNISQYFSSDPDYDELQEKELLQKLEDRSFLDDVMNSEAWRILREAWKRMYKDADELLTTCKPTDVATIAWAQANKRFYSDVLQNTIKQIKQDGDVAIRQLKQTNKLSKIRAKNKKK